MDYSSNKYRVWTWRHPLILHWIANPVLAINELLLGQRIAKTMLVERDGTKPVAERSFVPCPHCNTVHAAIKWSAQNKTAFGNWFGLYCDECGNIIPCVRNLTSLLLLIITSPVWYWFKGALREKWLQRQQQRFRKPMKLQYEGINWWHHSLGFAVCMFVFMSAFNYLIQHEPVTLKRVIIEMVVWAIGGLAYGLIFQRLVFKK